MTEFQFFVSQKIPTLIKKTSTDVGVETSESDKLYLENARAKRCQYK